MDVVYGVAAAVSLGLADFFAGGASRRLGPWPTMAATRVVGLLAMAVVVAFVPRPPAPSVAVAAAMLGVALASFGGVALLLRAFAIGAFALVAPIAASFAAVTAVLALVAGERPPGLALGGVALLVLGVAVVSRPGGPHAASLAGVPEAAGAAMCLGAAAWGFGEVTPYLGPY